MSVLNRRRFLKTAGTVALATAAIRCSPAEPRPNMLVILVDDLGYGDLSSYGATDLQSPNIDNLAAEGCKLTNFYANCPVCSPTRAALLSGRYQDLVGVPGVIRTHKSNSWGYLLPSAIMLPTRLRQAGYQTACIGKWHLGLESPNIPNERGFDYFKGFLGDMMDDYYTHRRFGNNYMRENTTEIDPEGHATDLFTEWANDYLRTYDGEKPFFLYLAYNAPHTPIQPPREWLNRVQQREPGMSEQRAKLVALIEHLDYGIGSVLKTLEDMDLAGNTIVVFVSDNGGQIRVGADNGETRLGKGTLYEGGIKVPAVVRWPGKIAPGSESNRIGLTMDILPTLFDAAHISIDQPADGKSFLPTLLGKEQPPNDRDLFFGRREGPDWWFKDAGAIYAIRRANWKLLQPKPGEPYELYNLADDPLESTNLAEREPEKFNELLEALQAQLARYEQVPWQKQS